MESKNVVAIVAPRCVLLRLLIVAMLFCMATGALAAQPLKRELPPGLQIPAAAQTGPGFDVDAATEAYLALLSPEQRRVSDRYFEGGYWLQLWGLLWAVSSCVLLLVTGISRRLATGRGESARVNGSARRSTLPWCSSRSPCSSFRSPSTAISCASINTA
jgi:hypothetical protein